MTATHASSLDVEVWADVVCPWCYLGRARLRRAVDEAGLASRVRLVHRAFELDPSRAPVAGEPVLDMLASRYGMSAEQAAQADARVAALCRAEGLPYTGDRRVGGTVLAHRLVLAAAEQGREQALLDALYAAHFGQGRDIFAATDLLDPAAVAGLDADAVAGALEGEAHLGAVRADEREAHELGADGVPFAVLGRRVAVPGAQEVATFVSALGQALAAIDA